MTDTERAIAARAGFTSWLDVRVLPEWDSYRPRLALLRTLTYYSEILQRLVLVRRGFVFDGESGPAASVLTGPLCHAPGAVHDWLYRTHEESRPTADFVYREALLSVGLDPVWAEQRYGAVSLYGQGAYDSGPSRLRILDLRELADARRPYGVLSERVSEPEAAPDRVEA